MKAETVAGKLSKALSDMCWEVAAGPDIVGEYVGKALSDSNDSCSITAFRNFVKAVEKEIKSE